MTTLYILAIAALLLESLILLRNKMFSTSFLLCLFFPPLALATNTIIELLTETRPLIPDIHYTFFWCVIGYIIMFTIVFRDTVMPKVHEIGTLSITILFWTILLNDLSLTEIFASPFFLGILICSVIILLNSLFSLPHTKASALFICVWYLSISTFLMLISIDFDLYRDLVDRSGTTPLLSLGDYVHVILNLAVALPFGFTFITLLGLIPISDNKHSFTFENWKTHANAILNKFDRHDLGFIRTLIVVIATSVVFYLNYRFTVVSTTVIISVTLLVLQLVFFTHDRIRTDPMPQGYEAELTTS